MSERTPTPDEVIRSQHKWPNSGLYLVKFVGCRRLILVMLYTDAEGYRCGVADNWIRAARLDDWTATVTAFYPATKPRRAAPG